MSRTLGLDDAFIGGLQAPAGQRVGAADGLAEVSGPQRLARISSLGIHGAGAGEPLAGAERVHPTHLPAAGGKRPPRLFAGLR